jgi:hypothetical protein
MFNAVTNPNLLMNFSKAGQVSDVIMQMLQPEVLRSQNRANVDGLFNGLPPFTAQQQKDNQIAWNTNLKQGTVLIQRANRQFENAILKPGSPFIVSLPDAPAAHADRWARTITRKLGRIIKKGRKSRQFMQVQRQQFKGVVLHGVGAKMWEDKEKWCPKFVAMQDILIPTDTDIDLVNLQYFAVRREMRPGELFKRIHANPKGWNKKIITKILDTMKDQNVSNQGETYSWADNPERWAEYWKQNLGYYISDKAPVIRMWDFFYREDEKEKGEDGWCRCIILDPNSSYASIDAKGDETPFIYESDGVFASELSQFFHFQFGDGNVVPPFKYHSIRSLGFTLYDTVYMANRLQIAFVEHVFEQMMLLLRVTDPVDRDRVTNILLENKGIIPTGVSIVPNTERYQIDNALVQTAGSNLRQLIGEASASFVDDLNNGTQKEETATAVMAKASQLNVMVGAMLNLAYNQEEECYQEICRRYCIKNSLDPDVQKFQKECKEDRIPAEWLNASRWDISAVRTLGNGDRTLELAEANQLRSMIPELQAINPNAPRIIMKRVVGATTNDALADELIPDNDNDQASDSVHDAQLVFSALMDGVAVAPKRGVNAQEQIKVILMLMQQKTQQIEQSGGVGTPADVQGLTMASGYVQNMMIQLQQDKGSKQFLKQSSDILGQVMNMVKAFAQRQQEQAQKAAEAQQQDPVAMAKIQMEAMRAQFQAQMDQQAAQIEAQMLKLKTETEAMAVKAKAEAEIASKNQLAQAEIARKNAVAAADIQRDNAKTAASIAQDQRKTDAAIASQRKKAAVNKAPKDQPKG